MQNEILIKRNYLLIDEISENSAYLNAKLLNQFGAYVDKPHLLSQNNLNVIADFYSTEIPASFYENPQDMNYFSADELIIEQIVSYFRIEIEGQYSQDSSTFERNEIFKKALPRYSQGDEMHLRRYTMITQNEADKILSALVQEFSQYTRPWSVDEMAEFSWLYKHGFYKNQVLQCKDNAIYMFLNYKDEQFAKMLDYKDIVKMSLIKYGKNKTFTMTSMDKILFVLALNSAHCCPLSIKQAKYFNRIAKKVKFKIERQTNAGSPYKKAINLIKNGDIVAGARVFNENGALLERNLVFLLSRANINQANEILGMLKNKKPIVLIQLMLGVLNSNSQNGRVFKFYFNNILKRHTETPIECEKRKSILSIGTKTQLKELLQENIKQYYLSQASLGKIYVSPQFKKIALPLNTSAMGMGLDVLPTGSRLPLTTDFVRAYCYWKDVFDIDLSVLFVKSFDEVEKFYWGNYATKKFGKSALSSGDCRDKKGSEFLDFRIKEIKDMGYKYAIVVLNGYGGKLNQGEIYCGYQNKRSLFTKVWSPKNIKLKIHVVGDSLEYVAFAIDFDKNEIIILNQVLQGYSVVDIDLAKSMNIYLDENYLQEFNLYKLLSYRGEMVSEPNDADIVFDEKYIGLDGQTVISPYNIEKIVDLLN